METLLRIWESAVKFNQEIDKFAKAYPDLFGFISFYFVGVVFAWLEIMFFEYMCRGLPLGVKVWFFVYSLFSWAGVMCIWIVGAGYYEKLRDEGRL